MTGVAGDAKATAPRNARLDALLGRLRAPVDGSSLAVFRIVFGFIALVEVYRYFSNGWIMRYWVEPEVHFTYVGFGWVHPPPEMWLYALWTLLAWAAIGIMLGLFYRVSCLVFAVGFGFCFLLEATRYLNHFYLITLLALLLACVPGDRVWSLDARLRRVPATTTIPAWSLWLLRFQIGVIYVYGAIAKLEPDWLRGEPMTMWLSDEGDRPLIGSLLIQDWAGPALAWAGLAFDLLIVFAVLWRRTRVVALIAAASFHAINNELFHIGVFPYLGFAALLLFCDPGWPRRLLQWVNEDDDPAPATHPAPAPLTDTRQRRLAVVALVVAAMFAVAQLVVPLRHLAFEGRSNWTEAGHTFSWHMKLRDKTGEAVFSVIDPATGRTSVVEPSLELTSWQEQKMAARPELIRQYAHHLARRFAADGVPGVEVYARTSVSLNGRPAQPLVDPAVDLAAEPPSLGTPSWVEPLTYPLP